MSAFHEPLFKEDNAQKNDVIQMVENPPKKV